MQDPPSPDVLVEAAARHFRADAPASAFLARVALNALDLAVRHLRRAADGEARERARLTALLNCDGTLEELNRALCMRIRAGDDAEVAGFVDHLWLATIEKVEVDQPNYSTLRLMRSRVREASGEDQE